MSPSALSSSSLIRLLPAVEPLWCVFQFSNSTVCWSSRCVRPAFSWVQWVLSWLLLWTLYQLGCLYLFHLIIFLRFCFVLLIGTYLLILLNSLFLHIRWVSYLSWSGRSAKYRRFPLGSEAQSRLAARGRHPGAACISCCGEAAAVPGYVGGQRSGPRNNHGARPQNLWPWWVWCSF